MKAMKIINLVALAILGSMILSAAISIVIHAILPQTVATVITLVVSFLVGYNARQATEKILGYTLLEAMEGDKKNE